MTRIFIFLFAFALQGQWVTFLTTETSEKMSNEQIDYALSSVSTKTSPKNKNLLKKEAINPKKNATQKRLLLIPKIDFEEVNTWYYAYIYNCFQEAKIYQPDVILFEIDTPGGYSDAASKIVSLILSSDCPVYVYIDENAISAGANIALAANKIFMRTGGIIGGSQPVNAKGEAHGEKYISILRTKFRALAELRKRPAIVCEAMVDSSVVLTQKTHGIECPKGKLLTLSSKQAKSIGIVEKIVNNRQEVIQEMGFDQNADCKIAHPSRTMRMLRFFGSLQMDDFLRFLTYMGFAIELRTPGWGFGGALAITSATLMFIIQLSLDKVEWFVPGIFGFGVLLVGLEAFVFPGLGFVGILGITLCMGSLLFGMGFTTITQAMTTGSLTLLGCFIVVSIILSIFSRIPFIRNLFSIDSQLRYILGEAPSCDKFRVMIGESGKVSVPLRPIGRVHFSSGSSVEAACVDNQYMEKGKKVRVVGFDDFKVLVEEIKR